MSPFFCYFQSNASCGNPNLMGKDVYIGSSYYPIAVWGGRAKIGITDNVCLKTGIYQSAPRENPLSGHGFNWSLDKSDGVQIPVEVGYSETTPGAITPNQYDIGAVIGRTHDQAAFYNPNSPTQCGRSVVYVQFQQMVYQAAPNSPRGLYLLGVGEVDAAGQTQPSDYSFHLGSVFQGPFASRPLDDAAFIVNGLHYRKNYLNALYTERVAAGGTQRPNADMVMLELNYTAQLNPWLNVTPNLQYIVNPDGLGGLAYPKANETNAFVVGFQFNLDVARALGLVLPDPS